MLINLLLAVRQSFDPAFRTVALKTTAISAALFAVLIAGAVWGLNALTLFETSWLDWAAKWAIGAVAGPAAVVVGIFLFPIVAVMVVGLFLEEIADAVDARHYPDKPAAPGQSIVSSVGSTGKLLLATLALNILVAPLYLVPGVNALVFYGLNGYLLGREYFELVALRRIGQRAARRLRREAPWRVFLGGVGITLLFSIPVVNWLMPIVATAFMVHEFDAIERRVAAPAGSGPDCPRGG